MRNISRIIVGVVISFACLSAQAQFGGFKIPFPGGNNSNSPNVVNMAGNAVKMVKGIDEPEEIQIGQDIAANVLGAWGLMPDEHLQRYVNALGRWLALQTERPDLPWTFAVLNDPGFNAFAAPGGYIFVTRGLIESIQYESELAGVLGHEIGHVLMKHHLKRIQTAAGADLLADLASASTKGGNPAIKSFLIGFTKEIYKKGLDRDEEFEADRIGVVIAARAGYDPFGLPYVLQILQKISSNDRGFSLLMSTHPLPADRLASLDQVIRDRFDSLPGVTGGTIWERSRKY